MGIDKLYFENEQAFWDFFRELKGDYPPNCTDELGNFCSTVKLQTLEITEQVDRGEISEDEARQLAKKSGLELGAECRFGLSSTRRCGFGVLCAMGRE